MRTARYPGIRSIVDGAEAVTWVEGHVCQAAFTHADGAAERMASSFERLLAAGERNLWGERLQATRHESGHSAGAACEGFALAGGRVTTFTGGEDLINMQEVMRAISGKRLPMVFHVAARSLITHAFSLDAGHDDILGVRDCGWGILIARNAQEASDFTAIARRASELSETPFLVAQDGFLTTHTVQTMRLPEPELLKVFVGAPSRRLRNLFNPAQPLVSGPLENEDSYMNGRIAQRFFFDRVRPSIETAMTDYHELTGRRTVLLRSYRMEGAEFVIAGMGSMMEAAETAADAMRSRGVRAGVLSIAGLRPFPGPDIVHALSQCRVVSVIERTDAPLGESNPLTGEIKSALADAQMGDEARLLHLPEVYSGSAGLGGRPVTPADFVSAFENMTRFGRHRFVLGIKHPDALTALPAPEVRPAGTFSARIHSLSGLGAERAARLVANVASDVYRMEAVALERHGAEDQCLPSVTVLVLAPQQVELNCAIAAIDLSVVQNPRAFSVAEPLAQLRAGGALLFDTAVPVSEAWASLPITVRRALRERHIDLFVYDGHKKPVALVGAILRVAKLSAANIPPGDLFSSLGRCLESRKPCAPVEDVQGQLAIARKAYDEVCRVTPPEQIVDYEKPATHTRLETEPATIYDPELVPPGFCEHVVRGYVQGRQAGLEADLYAARGLMPTGTASRRSFRHLDTRLPRFAANNCTGCMDCVNLCPDSAIVARVVEAEAITEAPAEIHEQFAFTAKYYESFVKHGESGGLFGLYVDADRCKGCGECVAVCGTRDAMAMGPKTDTDLKRHDRLREFVEALPPTPARFIGTKSLGDLMLSSEAHLCGGGSGSCPGCGQSSAIRMMLAATGFVHGAEQIGVVAPLGCHTGTGSTFPFNPYQVCWVNVTRGGGAADAMGVRMKWNREGHANRKIWLVGSDDVLFGDGFPSLTRLIELSLDINVLVLAQGLMVPAGELGARLLGFPNTFVAQTTPAHVNHFYNSVIEANSFAGPAVVVCYSACTSHDGILPDSASRQARLAVDSRAFPLFIYDPRAGELARERLDLRGNPALPDDWHHDPGTFEPVNFRTYAQTEGRFSTLPAGELDALQGRALGLWRRLREMAGMA